MIIKMIFLEENDAFLRYFWQDMARRGETGQDAARRGKTRQDGARSWSAPPFPLHDESVDRLLHTYRSSSISHRAHQKRNPWLVEDLLDRAASLGRRETRDLSDAAQGLHSTHLQGEG